MKKLTKTQEKEKDKHSTDLFDTFSALEMAVDDFNDKVVELRIGVEEAATAYNSAVARARDFCSEVMSDMDSYEGARSEKWQESDAGQSFQDWKSEWENVDLEDFEPEFPATIDVPDNMQEMLDALPTEVSS